MVAKIRKLYECTVLMVASRQALSRNNLWNANQYLWLMALPLLIPSMLAWLREAWAASTYLRGLNHRTSQRFASLAYC